MGDKKNQPARPNGKDQEGQQMATVRDVAKHAGVSVGTVSKVLARDATVKEVRRERVLQAIAELNYTPNQTARALRTKKVNVIGLVVPDITNPFFAKLAMQVEKHASARGHTVMLTNTMDDPRTEERQIAALLEQSLHGLIVVATNDSQDVSLGALDIPVVSLDRRYGATGLVSVDHETSSARVAEHLLDLGHRHLAYLAGPQDTETGRLRKAGFLKVVERTRAGGTDLTVDILEGAFDFDSGEDCARTLLDPARGAVPTAIATGNDQMAVGALRAANDLGMRVPDQLSVVGFDDIDLASIVIPRLTTIAQPTDKLCELAVSRLLSDKVADVRDASIAGALVIRGSSSPPDLAGTGASARGH